MTLAKGFRLERRGETWLIYDDLNPGFVLYVGGAAGALALIEKKGLQP